MALGLDLRTLSDEWQGAIASYEEARTAAAHARLCLAETEHGIGAVEAATARDVEGRNAEERAANLRTYLEGASYWQAAKTAQRQHEHDARVFDAKAAASLERCRYYAAIVATLAHEPAR